MGQATGSTGHAPCDPNKLAASLQAEPLKAQAWAQAHGIGTQQIAGYLSSLTPTYLKSDTLTMNHAYDNGRDTSNPAVLQAGTGVLVDKTGVPVVKCNCDNPLTRPTKNISVTDSVYVGAAWNGFSKERITKTPVYTGGTVHGTDMGTGTDGDNGTGMMKKRPTTYQEYVAWCKGVRGPAPGVDCSGPPPQQGQGQTGTGTGGTGQGGTGTGQSGGMGQGGTGTGQTGGTGRTEGTGQGGVTGRPGGTKVPGGIENVPGKTTQPPVTGQPGGVKVPGIP